MSEERDLRGYRGLAVFKLEFAESGGFLDRTSYQNAKCLKKVERQTPPLLIVDPASSIIRMPTSQAPSPCTLSP